MGRKTTTQNKETKPDGPEQVHHLIIFSSLHNFFHRYFKSQIAYTQNIQVLFMLYLYTGWSGSIYFIRYLFPYYSWNSCVQKMKAVFAVSSFTKIFVVVLFVFFSLSCKRVYKVGHLAGLGPVVQGIISLTSSLVVKILIVLINTISNSQVFLLKKKCE